MDTTKLAARAIPLSVITGRTVTLHNEADAVVGQLLIRCVESQEDADTIADWIVSLINSEDAS